MPEPPAPRDLILTARWLLPISSPPVENGALLVRDGRIARAGPAPEILGAALPGAPRIDLGLAAILPGLVNAHTHLELAILRGFCEELEFFPWIRKLTQAKRSISRDDLALSARWGALQAIRAGVTSVADASDSGATLDAVVESGLRGVVYQEVFGPDEGQVEASLRELELALDAQLLRATSRVRVGVSPHAPYTVSAALFRRVARLALERKLPVAVHAAESRAERLLLREGAGPFAAFLEGRGIAWRAPRASTVSYLSSLGLLETRPLLIHLVDASAEDLDLVEEAGAAVAHCPKSNAKLCHGIAPLLELAARGIRTGLGTDGAVSSNNCDLFEEARCAVLLQRARRDAPPGRLESLDARAVLRLLTLGGAEALGLDAEVGSLSPGKLADLTAVDLSGPHHAPVRDPEVSIAFSASAADVLLTVVGGQVLYREGVVTTMDEGALREDLERAARRLPV